MGLMDLIKRKRLSERDAWVSTVAASLRAEVEGKSLTPAQQKAFEAAADGLGLIDEQLEFIAQAIRDEITLSAAAEPRVRLHDDYRKRSQAYSEYVSETEQLRKDHERIMRERQEQASQLGIAANAVRDKASAAVDAENALRRNRHENWRWLGLSAQPALTQVSYRWFADGPDAFSDEPANGTSAVDEPHGQAAPHGQADAPSATVDVPTPDQHARLMRQRRNEQVIAGYRQAVRDTQAASEVAAGRSA
jgi:hypothetical protein